MNKPCKILLLENIHQVAQERLRSEGFAVECRPDSPPSEELNEIFREFDLVGIRSKTEIKAEHLVNSRLMAIGCFCIGTNQVDLAACNRSGIPVFNAPHSNTRSVAELVIAEIIALSRQLADRSTAAHQGNWIKSAEGSREVRGKTLGIVGYGHIGSQLSILAEALGMVVLFYDIDKKLPLGNALASGSLDELLRRSDFVSLHVPETQLTRNLMGADQFRKMKKGSYFLNLSRGTVVDIEALAAVLKEKHLAGCAIDVFPTEPSSNKEKFVSPLQGLSNVILSPHIGGSTEEAQYAIGQEVAESFSRHIRRGATAGAVNFPQVDIQRFPGSARILNVHRNEPGVLSEINSHVSKRGANIVGQQLATDSHIGYLVMDVEGAEADALAADIKQLSRSIRTRVLKP